jgi:hypothetical protein
VQCRPSLGAPKGVLEGSPPGAARRFGQRRVQFWRRRIRRVGCVFIPFGGWRGPQSLTIKVKDVTTKLMSLSSEVCFRLGSCVLSEWLVEFNVLVGNSWIFVNACRSVHPCDWGINTPSQDVVLAVSCNLVDMWVACGGDDLANGVWYGNCQYFLDRVANRR